VCFARSLAVSPPPAYLSNSRLAGMVRGLSGAGGRACTALPLTNFALVFACPSISPAGLGFGRKSYVAVCLLIAAWGYLLV
jgi:hypothetical protein